MPKPNRAQRLIPFSLLLLIILACRPVITVGWQEVVILVILFFMMPIFWLLTTAFKFGREAFAIPPKWIFFDFTLKNFQEVWNNTDVLRFLKNSIIITTGTTILSLLLGVPAGYAIARSKSFLINSSSYFFLILLMVPPIASAIPRLTGRPWRRNSQSTRRSRS